MLVTISFVAWQNCLQGVSDISEASQSLQAASSVFQNEIHKFQQHQTQNGGSKQTIFAAEPTSLPTLYFEAKNEEKSHWAQASFLG